MIRTRSCPLTPTDRPSATGQFRADVLRGLRALQKYLPCKYFYDDAGSELFERITELEEYYPTRTERSIMERHAAAMAGLLGRRCLLVEYGSGSSTKTRLLLDHLVDPAPSTAGSTRSASPPAQALRSNRWRTGRTCP